MIIGRKKEQLLLKEACESKQSSFIVVHGRRRIGKTFLVRNFFENEFTFFFTGSYRLSTKDELLEFNKSLIKYGHTSTNKIKSWSDAFGELELLIEKSDLKKKIIFIDELSWLDMPNSKFLTSLERFWNAFASARDDIVLIVASSSTSWTLNKVLRNKGGLYGRITQTIHLKPLELSECQKLLEIEKDAFLTKQEIVQLYMVFGGVPYYWTKYRKDYSVDQNINDLFFSKNSELSNEFNSLFSSMFLNYNEHLNIIKILGNNKSGMTREEIRNKLGKKSGGSISLILEELESCDFIRCFYNYKNKNNKVYQIIDEFTLFYLRFAMNKNVSTDYWLNGIKDSTHYNWLGLAYEMICLKHEEKIRKALGINGISTLVCSYKSTPNVELGLNGCQIDLIFERADNVINLFEIKYSQDKYTLSKTEYDKLLERKNIFVTKEKIKKSVWYVIITTNGLNKNIYSSIFNKEITLEDLFN